MSAKKIIFINDCRHRCGVADNFQGIASTYKIAKDLGVDFFIYWTYPVDIKHFLLPNEHNWIISENEIIRNSINFKNFFFYNSIKKKDVKFKIKDGILHFRSQENKQYARMKETFEKVLSRYDQLCVFSNVNFTETDDYDVLMDELFKPSQQLQILINYHLEKIADKYCSATFRFQHLLGDFIEGKYPTLKEAKKEALIEECLKQIELIYQSNNYKKILITSDSITFLQRASSAFDFVYAVPEKLAHIGLNPGHSPEVYMKSFVDYFLLTKSERVYSVIIDKMYNSGFPRMAAAHKRTEFIRVYA
jgi:hypothetical protein